MAKECEITVDKTPHGGAFVGIQFQLEGNSLLDLAAEETIEGSISADSQVEINEACAKAKWAGIADYTAFSSALEKLGLKVDCSICPHFLDKK